jgi:hypothetical protein
MSLPGASDGNSSQLNLQLQVDRSRGPKGARVGDIIVADRSRWRVQDIDLERREVICKLLAGAHTLRRFRARAIERLERAPKSRRPSSARRL